MTQIGTIELLASVDTAQYKKGASEINKANQDMEGSTERTAGNMNSGFSKVAKVGLAAVAAATIAVGVLITKNIGDAVKRVDTLNNSARTFENMGFTADKVSGAMKALEQSIRGMPTPLDEAVRGMQMISASTNDIGKSQKIFTAMNNAIIGFGGSSADVTNAILQMSQAFAGGRIDAQTWNSMLNSNLGPALSAIARQMGITTKALKEGLSEGTISVEQFQQALIDMNEKGGGGMKSFEQIAKDATSGIGTGWANLQTAVTRGIAAIIESIGSEKISSALASVGKVFEDVLKNIAKLITAIAGNEPALYAIAAVIGTVLVAAFAALGVAIWTALAPTLPFAAAIAALAGVVYLLKANWEKLLPVIQPITDAVKQLWELIKPFREFLVTQFITAWNQLKDSFDRMMVALQPFMPQLKILAIIIGVVLITPMLLLIAVVGVVIAVFVAVIAIVARVIAFMSSLSASFLEAAGRIQSAVSDRIGSIINFFRELPGRILSALGNMGMLLYDAGRQIVNGLKNGIMDAANSAIDAIKGVAGKITGTFKSALGIQSPSKVFEGFGHDITAGLVSGLNEGSSMIENAVGGLTNATISPVVGTLDNASSNSLGGPAASVNVTLNMSGIMSRSRSDERSIAKSLVESLNEELRAKGQPQIGVTP